MKFSSYEQYELLKAWSAVSLAFAILLSDGLSGLFTFHFLLMIVVAAITVGIGFLLHELAHKYLAQQYGCWAEFRSDGKMLLFMIALSFFGFIFAAPGAVVIHGTVDRVRHGRISLAGPATNIVLAILFWFLSFILPEALALFSSYGFMINSWLGLFNMLPFWQFDGAKVFAWNKIVFSFVIGIAALLTFASGF
ncbi:MAG: hypothetical protein AABX72_00150 [Nanoarchaeota archaeon]